MTVRLRNQLFAGISLLAMTANAAAPAIAATTAENDSNTTTPIKHVIIIIGENRSFDHVFATYVPPKGTVDNLLSKQIINADGTQGPKAALAAQYSASDLVSYQIAPGYKVRYDNLPPIMTGGAPTAASATSPPFAGLSTTQLEAIDGALETADINLITTGATGLPTGSIDTRIPNAASPANAPFQISNPKGTATYDSYAASPVHRFYQMFQQMDCSTDYATGANPSGCLNDLFPWVEVTIGAGSNGQPQPSGFNNQTTGEGSTSMGFYNVQTGDMPYFKSLADTYALGDNYHQPAKGGTGADSVYLGYASDVWYADPTTGKPAVPPSNQIENPNPLNGTNNWYTQDGYSGGTYTNCSDETQPAVSTIRSYLSALHVKANCQAGRYYLLNNYNPGFNGDGSAAPLGPGVFTIPPQSQRSIANTLDTAKVSWTYYGEGWDGYVSNTAPGNAIYCNICNPFLYQSYVMTNPAKRAANLKDTTDLYADLQNGVLPAVSWVKPGGVNDGHPASSKFDIFEAFTKKVLDLLAANPALAAETAVFITVDEGGGYYDSGYIQTVDYFGDGTRIPMIAVSPYSKGVGVVHSYGDHASFIKFVNRNWGLPAIDGYSRDNLPNPIQTSGNPYVPVNRPAIDDLMSYFRFPDHDHDHDKN